VYTPCGAVLKEGALEYRIDMDSDGTDDFVAYLTT